MYRVVYAGDHYEMVSQTHCRKIRWIAKSHICWSTADSTKGRRSHLRFKQENPRWGFKKIRDQVVYLGYTICKSSVKNILIENGYDPEPDLTVRSTWHELIRSHWDVLAACDFFTIELLVGHRLVRCTLFFVMELATRKVSFAPVKLQPDGTYMRQVVRILTDGEDGFLNGKRYLIYDRDPLYRTEGFHETLRATGKDPRFWPDNH